MQRIYDFKIGGMTRNIAEVHGEIGGTIMTFAEIFVLNNSIIKGSAGLLGGALFININSENPKKLYMRLLNSLFDKNIA